MQLDEKISQAKARLLVQNPYFGTLASRLEFKQNDNLQSFLSNGQRFEYNDTYLAQLDLDEIGFALSNAAMHAALAHDNRQKNRMTWLWQLATDHAINAMLIANGLDAPFGINYQERFEGMYAEEIYAVLKEEIKNEEFDDNEANETGFNEDNRRLQNEQNAPGKLSHEKTPRRQQEVDNESRSIDEEAFKQLMQEASKKFKNALPEGIERFFELGDAKVDWRSELYRAIDRHYYHDYVQMPPSKKLLYMGTYLPSLSSDMLRLVIAIDSSGSVDETLLGRFISEFESILLSFSHFELTLLVCDDRIRSVQTFSSAQKIEYALKGGGATDFRPVFEYLREHASQTQLLLYFSDLEGRFPDEEPLFETVWVSQSDKSVPFGRVIRL